MGAGVMDRGGGGKRRRSHSKRKPMAEINVTPFVDVMLVLLIIFMVTAPMMEQGVTVDLPQAEAKPIKTQTTEPMIITVDKNNQLYFNKAEKPVAAMSESELLRLVLLEKKNNPDISVLLRGDEQTRYGQIIVIMNVLKKAGIKQVGLMTESL